MKRLLRTLAVLSLALLLTARSGHSENAADRQWTDKHFLTAFEDFFPIRHGQGDFIAVRAHQNGSHEAREFSFIIDNTQDAHKIAGTIREAESASLYQQLLTLHRRDPSKSYADLKPELNVRAWNLTVADCPAVLAQFTAFENIRFVRPRDDQEVEENPILYEVDETVAGGSSEVVEFIPTRAIPLWANQTRTALLACAVPQPASGSTTDKKEP
jgi:hypothetical protein